MDFYSIKRIVGIVVGFTCVILAVSLFFLLPVGRGFAAIGMMAKTPYDYPGSSWYSEDPQIWLEVSNEMKAEPNCCTAKMLDGNQTISVIFIADPLQSKVAIYRDTKSDILYSDNLLIEGEMLLSTKEVFSFRVVNDSLYNGQYKTITLNRK